MILGVSDITETFIIQLQLKIVYISGSIDIKNYQGKYW